MKVRALTRARGRKNRKLTSLLSLSLSRLQAAVAGDSLGGALDAALAALHASLDASRAGASAAAAEAAAPAGRLSPKPEAGEGDAAAPAVANGHAGPPDQIIPVKLEDGGAPGAGAAVKKADEEEGARGAEEALAKLSDDPVVLRLLGWHRAHLEVRA